MAESVNKTKRHRCEISRDIISTIPYIRVVGAHFKSAADGVRVSSPYSFSGGSEGK